MGMSAVLSATLCFRSREGDLVKDAEWLEVPLDTLRAVVPWRTFRWGKGQKHYSGTYWSATQCDHVIYESRLGWPGFWRNGRLLRARSPGCRG